MRVTVFGAAGRTGRHLVTGAVARHHEVTAFVRRRDGAPQPPGVRLVEGDVADPAAVRRAVAGRDAVICALGAATPVRRDPTLVTGIRQIIAAMTDAGVPRLVYLSFLGVPDGRRQLSALGRLAVAPILLRNVSADHAEKEALIAASAVDWTIVRPPRLTDGPATGVYRHGTDIRATSVVPTISRADLARFMLDQLDTTEYVHCRPALMY
ncbi:NAD(P)-dependent oxidoreductase [Plantactinospora sp. GCM10030261]|uniref:NAD(P)-dependent oxidoreductase n=1 Tax=Plantactinospora sp. GCM10030261 TaxID=3273420 RepID=UPI0036217F39